MLTKAAPQDNLQGQHVLVRDTKCTKGNVQRGIYLVNYSFRNIMDKRVEAREVLHSNTLFLDFLSECTPRASQAHWKTFHAHLVPALHLFLEMCECL